MSKITLPSPADIIHRTPLWGDNPIIYQDILDAVNAGAIKVLGALTTDFTTYNTPTAWNNRRIYSFGNIEADGNGAEILIPDGYDTVWVRVLGERWNIIKAYFLDGDQAQLGHWGGGYRKLCNYQPDSAIRSRSWNVHEWIPISAGKSGRLALIHKIAGTGFWLSGVAFSKNPFNLAVKHAITAYCNSDAAIGAQYTNGAGGVIWNNSAWNNDVLAEVKTNTNASVMVPVIPNGRDKALYLILHTNAWNEVCPENTLVNDRLISDKWQWRDTPVARWYSRGLYNSAVTIRVSANIIGNERLIKVGLNMAMSNKGLFFREIGTHDYI